MTCTALPEAKKALLRVCFVLRRRYEYGVVMGEIRGILLLTKQLSVSKCFDSCLLHTLGGREGESVINWHRTLARWLLGSLAHWLTGLTGLTGLASRVADKLAARVDRRRRRTSSLVVLVLVRTK
jgi:hypothetical protein